MKIFHAMVPLIVHFLPCLQLTLLIDDLLMVGGQQMMEGLEKGFIHIAEDLSQFRSAVNYVN